MCFSTGDSILLRRIPFCLEVRMRRHVECDTDAACKVTALEVYYYFKGGGGCVNHQWTTKLCKRRPQQDT
jgi:hypothetical protein